MKKLIALLLALAMTACLFACGETEQEPTTKPTEAPTEAPTEPSEPSDPSDPADPDDGIMSYEEYLAAEYETEVTVICYVQANQSWWNGKVRIYAADKEGGAYFLFDTICEEADAALLTPGTAIKVTGTKIIWDGLIEISEGTFEILKDEAPFIATPVDLTAKLGTNELSNHMNALATFKGMTVKNIEYKNGAPGDDIYITLTKDGKDYNFCVEAYLTTTTPGSTVYETVGTLNAGDVVDVTAFVYWYLDNPNPHITAISLAQ